MIRRRETIVCRRFDIQLRVLEVINKAHAWKRLSEHQVAEKQHCNMKSKNENEEQHRTNINRMSSCGYSSVVFGN
jgi:hypothetical protein